MAILGIDNRTENWKTASAFAPAFADSARRLKLATRLGESEETRPQDVQIELYWKGMRDHFYPDRKLTIHDENLSERYKRLFPDLRDKLLSFAGFRDLKDWNYDVSIADRRRILGNNLFNVEVDIVIESPSNLFIGEAKGEMTYEARSKHVLAHQLIRQYVMARILLDLRRSAKKVVPFVIGDAAERLRRRQQVKFMIEHLGMEKANVLEWEDLTPLFRNT